MNEKLQYAKMLDIPTSTCSVSYKRPRKRIRLFKKTEKPVSPKEELINLVNGKNIFEGEERPPEDENALNNIALEDTADDVSGAEVSEGVFDEEKEDGDVITDESFNDGSDGVTYSVKSAKPKRKKFKIGVLGIEVVAICALVATILITNALVPDSGINVFMKSVFGASNRAATTVIDNKVYSEYNASAPATASSLTINEGVITIGKAGSVYSPCDGKIDKITFSEETQKYDVEISHGENFKTCFSGLDFVYQSVGGRVFTSLPVGYVKSSATACFLDENDAVITNFTLEDTAVKWMV